MSTIPPEDGKPNPNPERDWDAEFAEITAHLDDMAGDPQTDQQVRWGAPASQDSLTETARPEPDPQTEPETAATEPTAPDPTAVTEPSADDEDFVPPDPRPLPTDDPATSIMIGALVVGPLWLVYLTVFDREARGLWWVFAGLLTTLGFVLAVLRQPTSRNEDDPDDGARL